MGLKGINNIHKNMFYQKGKFMNSIQIMRQKILTGKHFKIGIQHEKLRADFILLFNKNI